MTINQAGLVPFSDASIPVIVIDAVGTPTLIPVSLFPAWLNDAGVQAFGGAAVISIFDDGLAEGATGKTQAVTQQPIAAVGGITVLNPQAAETYAVRIRLRSAVADANYVDRVVRFRVVTPLLVPFATTQFLATQEPDITVVVGQIQFAATVGTFPAGEIRLQNGKGGIVLPSVAGVNWGSDAQAFVQELSQRRRRSLITIDFAPSGTAEGWMRLTYTVSFDAMTGAMTFTRFRRWDFSNWGYFSGSDMSFAEASIDMVGGTASITFMRGLYALGPHFESVWAVGRKGSMPINPQLLLAGGSVDVSQVIDFSARSHLSQTGVADKHVLLVVQTPTQNLMHEIPLRLQGYHDFVGEDGVTNYFAASMGASLPATPPLFLRYLIYPYLEVPNFTNFYDPNDAFLPGPGSLGYPRVENIAIYAANAAVANQTFTDVIAMHNAMASIAMPTIGIARHVLDVRTFTTPIPQGTPFLTVTMDIDDGTTVSSIVAYYALNEDGQPQSWRLPASLATAVDAPDLEFNQVARTLDVVITAPTAIDTAAIVRGDLDEAAVVLTVPGTTVIPQSTIDAVLSPLGEILELEFENAAGVFKRRVGAINPTTEMIVGSTANAIRCWFTGSALILVDVSAIDVNADGKREITIVGDGPAVLIPDAQDATTEMVNFQQASPLGPDVMQTHVDLLYLSGAAEHRLRVYSNFFDARSANPRTIMNTPRPMWGSTGVEYELTTFAAPNVRYDLAARTVEFDRDGRVYNFRAWRLENLATDERVDFIGPPTQGRVYAVGSVLRDIAPGAKLMFVAQHQNGTQRVFTGEVRPKSHGFQRLREVRLLPSIG